MIRLDKLNSLTAIVNALSRESLVRLKSIMIFSAWCPALWKLFLIDLSEVPAGDFASQILLLIKKSGLLVPGMLIGLIASIVMPNLVSNNAQLYS